MQSQILKRYPDADLRVYVVWLPVMPLDARFEGKDLVVQTWNQKSRYAPKDTSEVRLRYEQAAWARATGGLVLAIVGFGVAQAHLPTTVSVDRVVEVTDTNVGPVALRQIRELIADLLGL